MSALPALERPARGVVLWTLAAGLLAHALTERFEGAPAPGASVVLGFLLGALPLTSGLLGRPWRLAVLEPLLGGLATAAAAAVASGLVPLVAPHVPFAVPLLLVLLAALAVTGRGTLGRLRTLIGVEWLKLRRGRLLRVSLLVTAAVTLLASVTHDPVEAETTGWTQAASSMGVGFWTAEILLFVLGATTVAGEISQGTLKMILPHAYRRAEWVSAKAFVLVVAALLFALVVGATGLGHAALDAGLGDVTRKARPEFGMPEQVSLFRESGAMFARIAQTTLAAVGSLATCAFVGLLLSCVFHGLVAALSASFFVFAVIKAGRDFLGLASEELKLIYAYHPDKLRQMTEALGKAYDEGWDDTLLPGGLYLALLTGGAALVLSLRLFGRRDLHG